MDVALAEQMPREDPKSVEITYTQTSTYATADPAFTSRDIVREPFATMLARGDYLAFQQIRHRDYAHVSHASAAVLPGQREPVFSEAVSSGDHAKRGLGLGVFVFVGLTCLLAVQLLLRRARRKKLVEHFWGFRNMSTLSTAPEGKEVDESDRCRGSFNSEETIDIIALPGRVGCVIDRSCDTGPFICEIQDTSPLRGDLKLGDRIVAVDEEDVHQMSAVEVSKLLGSRSNRERKITVLRVGNSSSLESVESGPSAAASIDPPGTRAPSERSLA